MALTQIKAAALTADLIDETKLADNSIDSEHYNDGSIDNAHLADDAVGVAELSATGTASSSTFLRGDNSWATPTDTNTVTTINNNADNRVITGSGTANTLEGEATLTYDDPTLKIDTSSSYGALKLDGSSGGLIEFYEDGTRRWEIYGVDSSLQIYDRDNTSYHTKFLDGGDLEVFNGDVKFASSKGLEFQNSVTIKEGSSNLNIDIAAGNNNIEFKSGGTAFLKLRGTNGNVEVASGNVEIGTAGKGIHFHNYGTGTGIDSNLLDDYEEGSFTPAFPANGGKTGSITYHNQVGFYTKIGNTVFARVYMQTEGGSTDSNSLRVSGLPFACTSTTSREGGGYHRYQNAFFTSDDAKGNHPWVSLSESSVVFHKYSDGASVLGSHTTTSQHYLIFDVQYTTS